MNNKWSKLFYALTMGLLLAACTGPKAAKPAMPPQIHQEHNVMVYKKIYVDAKFNQDERELIQKSAEIWRHDTSGIMNFDLVFDYDLSDKSDKDPNKYTNKIVLKRLTSDDPLTKDIDDAINEELNEDNEGDPIVARMLGYTMNKGRYMYIYVVPDRHMKKEHIKRLDQDAGILYNTMVEMLDKDALLNTILHEIGHSVGLSHYDKSRSIMNTMYDLYIEKITGVKPDPIICLTTADAMQFCNIYNCEFEKLNHC